MPESSEGVSKVQIAAMGEMPAPGIENKEE